MRALFAVLSTGLAVAFGSAATAATSTTPPVSAIKKQLTDHYTDKLYATRQYRIAWGKFQFGTPRPGDYLSDGVPANTRTTVYPVRTTFVRTTHYTTDNSNVIDTISADYVFFKDDYGTWTFRIKAEKMTTKRS